MHTPMHTPRPMHKPMSMPIPMSTRHMHMPLPLKALADSLPGLQHESGALPGLSRDVNRQLRHALLQQRPLSNRFHGSSLALRAERAYRDFVSQYQRHKVAWQRTTPNPQP